MLKFLRKYQKTMLVVFCVGLMFVFLIPQAAQQFAPNPANTVLVTLYGEKEITREQVTRVNADLQMMRRLQIEPSQFALYGLTLLPLTDSERNDALAWIMIQEAAERNGLGASRQESFNLIASVLGMQDFDSLDEKAKEFDTNGEYLIELGRQYLVAEQYRQLVAGIEFNLPEEDDDITSPGLRRVLAMKAALEYLQRQASNQQFQMQMQFAQMQGISPDLFLYNELLTRGFIDRIQGHERFSATEVRYALQQQYAEIDLTVVVLDAEDRLDTTVVDDAYIQGIFDRFADDQPGTGEPYGLGYREPNKVQLEALRIPIDAVREAVAKTITPEDVRSYYNEDPYRFIDLTPPAEGETPRTGPPELTFELRDQIRLTLTETRAGELVQKIAQQARLRLNEDARGLPDDGIYKKLPDDFEPTSLAIVATEIEREHGVVPEIITVDEFVSSQDLIDKTRFTQAWVSKMPNATVKMPDSQFGLMTDIPIPQTVLGGSAGLFTADVPAVSQSVGRFIRLADYLTATRAFLEPEQLEQATRALQVGLPGEYLRDATGSTYVFRITKAQPAPPAPSHPPIAEQVREDAIKVKAYEDLAGEKDALLQTATELGIERLMPDADAKNTLSGLTRGASNQFNARIDGLSTTQPIVTRAFQITDDLLASGGVNDADEEARLFAVELAGDYKLALVRIDTYRPMTRLAFEQEAAKPSALLLARNLGASGPPEPALSFEALQRYTDFEWAEGFGPDEEEEDSSDSEESE